MADHVLMCILSPEGQKIIICDSTKCVKDVVEDIGEYGVEGAVDQSGPWCEIQPEINVKTLQNFFGTKFLRRKTPPAPPPPEKVVLIEDDAGERTAFDLMMSSRSHVIPDRKKSSAGVKEGLSLKDTIYNNIVAVCEENEWYFTTKEEGAYIIQTITNAMWLINDAHQILEDAHQHDRMVKKMPEILQRCKTQPAAKKKRRVVLKASDLTSHSQAILKLCEKPQLQTKRLQPFQELILKLHGCLVSYCAYLEKKNESMQNVHEADKPVRQVSENVTVEFKEKTDDVIQILTLLNRKLADGPNWEAVSFDENVETGTLSAMQRFRLLNNMQLSVDVLMFRYCPGGNQKTIVYLCKVPAGCTEDEKSTGQARVLAKLMPNLPEYHTRYMRREFKERVQRVASVSPALLEYIYANLTGDASAPGDNLLRQRVTIAALGEPNLVTDLRHLNPGRPKDGYDPFWEMLAEVTAADERRHGEAHLSELLSIRDAMERTKARCDPDTKIPSSALVRLQFAPRNRFTERALQFTSRFDVQRKVQVRQLRQSHPDAHYVAAYFKYLKMRSIALRGLSRVVFLDDKAKVPVGEPRQYISTGVRGKAVFTPSTSTLSALDHDTSSKAKITPSVALIPAIPPDDTCSWYQGQVTVTLYDSVLEQSGSYQAAALLVREASVDPKPVLFKYSDGGSEHRTNLIKVQLGLIAAFKILNLDLLVSLRTAPGQSWSNPVERVMSILNLGLQNVSTAREQGSTQLEAAIKNCKSMAEIRKKIGDDEELAQEWQDSLNDVKKLLGERFQRLQLKEVPFIVRETVDDKEVLERLKGLFPDLNPHTVTKSRVPADIKMWIQRHCRERQYTFQVRKCADTQCCSPPVTQPADREWLPDPVLDGTGEHYLPLAEVLGTDTTDTQRPGASAVFKRAKQKAPVNPFMEEDTEKQKKQSTLFTVQHARMCVECAECSKPRIVYAMKKLTNKQQAALRAENEESEYTCGSYAVPPESSLSEIAQCRLQLTCADPVELPYYGSRLGRVDICSHCAGTGATVDPEKKKQFKSVLPLCTVCLASGIEPVLKRSKIMYICWWIVDSTIRSEDRDFIL